MEATLWWGFRNNEKKKKKIGRKRVPIEGMRQVYTKQFEWLNGDNHDAMPSTCSALINLQIETGFNPIPVFT